MSQSKQNMLKALEKALEIAAEHVKSTNDALPGEDPFDMLWPAECKPIDDALVWRIVYANTGSSTYVTTMESVIDQSHVSARLADHDMIEQFHSGHWDLSDDKRPYQCGACGERYSKPVDINGCVKCHAAAS